MFRFSQEYFKQKSGLHLPETGLILPPLDIVEHNEFMDLADHMAEDFRSGRATDLLIDDRDIKKPLNFFDFYCGGPRSGGHIAFPKQIQAATNMLQEHCTNTTGHFQCTDLDYVADIPTHATYDQIQEKVTFLHHGTCPICGKTRMDQWNEGNTRKDILVIVAGQRCLIGATRLLTSEGIQRIGSLSNRVEGWSPYKGPAAVLENGLLVQPTEFFQASPEHVYRVILKNGYQLTGTFCHPIKGLDAFYKLEELSIDQPIPIHVGQNIWGSQSLDFKNIIKPIVPQVKPCDTKQNGPLTEDIASLLGLWVAEGYMRPGSISIANTDRHVLDFCRLAMRHLYPSLKVSYNNRNLVWYSENARQHFKQLLNPCKNSYDKSIPDHILSSPHYLVCAFLKGLYEGDGYVCFGKKGKDHGGYIGYTSVSRRLVFDLSCILGNMGIFHNILYRRQPYKGRIVKAFELKIKGLSEAEKFRDMVGFLCPAKQSQLDVFINNMKTRTNHVPYWYEIYPTAVKQQLLDILDEIHNDQQQSFHNTRFKHRRSIRQFFALNSDLTRIYAHNVSLSRSRLQRIANGLQGSLWWTIDPIIRQKFLTFMDVYGNPNIAWTSVSRKSISTTKHRTYDLRVPTYSRFMSDGFLSHNSGKDRTTALLGGYLHGCYLTLRNLSRAYKMGEGTVFYTTFTATTQTQALKATFTPFLDIIEKHPFFRQYHEMLDYSGQKAGKELYKVGKENVAWSHHGLVVTVEAPDDKNLRGTAKIFGSISEFSYFYSAAKKSVKYDGNQIFKAMNNSFGTIKIGYRKCVDDGLFDMPPYMLPLVSSPRSYKDNIMRYYRMSKTTPTMYGMHYSTFDFNPEAREEDYVTEKATNPEGFRTDFLALPADAVRAFIKSRRLVSTAPDEDQVNAYRSKSVFVKSGAGMKQTGGQIELRKSPSINLTTPKVMGFDLSAVSNSCAFVIAHVEQEESDSNMDVFLTVVDAIVEIIPPQDGTRINPTRLYEDVILPMCEQMNVQYVFADHWESARVFTDLDEHLGIQGMQYRCKYQDFLNLRTAIDDRLIVLPKNEVTLENDPVKNLNAIFTLSETGYPLCFEGKPVAHLLYQLLTVEDVMGKTVEKGENSTDDIFRALVLAHKFCHEDPDIRDTVSGVSEEVVENNDFRMVSIGLDGRVMDKKEIKPVQAEDTEKMMATQPFGVIVPLGQMPKGGKW